MAGFKTSGCMLARDTLLGLSVTESARAEKEGRREGKRERESGVREKEKPRGGGERKRD